jgi:hypothetical protein
MGPLSKLAQVAPLHNQNAESTNFAKSSGNPTFESEGDVFPRKRIKRKCFSDPKTMKVQSQCKSVTLPGESVHNNHSFDSSGLNLACEGLLLGGKERRL